MNRATIEKYVLETLAEVLNREQGEITLDTVLVKDLGMDSFNAVEIVYALQEKLKVQIPQTSFTGVEKVRDIVSVLEKQLG